MGDGVDHGVGHVDAVVDGDGHYFYLDVYSYLR